MIHWINSAASYWVHVFTMMNLQNTLFLVIALLLLRGLRNHSPQLTGLLALVALIKLLLPPIAPPFLLFGGDSPSLPFMEVVTQTPAVGHPTVREPSLSLTGIIFLVWSAAVIVLLGIYFYRYFRFSRLAGKSAGSGSAQIGAGIG